MAETVQLDVTKGGTTYNFIRDTVTEVATEQSQALLQDITDTYDSLSAQIGADNVEVAALAAKAAAKEVADESTTGEVNLSDGQWSELTGYLQMQRDSLQLQNALLIFTLMLCAGLVGMRVFSEFARGFRRG